MARGTLPNPTGGGAALPSQTGKAGQALVTDGASAQWSPSGTIDTDTIPAASSTLGNPGTSTKAAPADHSHPRDPAAAPLYVPLWMTADSACLSLPRGHLDDSDSFNSTPASGVEHFTFLRADKALTVAHVRFGTGGKTPAGITLARIGLYTVAGGTYTLVASSAAKAGFGGAYGQIDAPLTVPYTLVPGTIYAIGNLQVGTTPNSLFGAWYNNAYLNSSPAMALTKSGMTDLGASVSGAGTSNFPIAYELTA
jgi:hypothetical protein